MSDGSLRADARRSRAALVAAFRRLAAERGADVPLYEVAQEAAVGQGTLYRHFADRTALLAAVFEEEIDALERKVSGDHPPSLLALLADISVAQAQMHGLSEALIAAGTAGPQLQRLASRTERLLERPLATALAAGMVRHDIVLADVIAVMSMMEGLLIGLRSLEERQAAIERGMRIAIRGLRAADHDSGTVDRASEGGR